MRTEIHLCERCRRHTELYYCPSVDEYLCDDCISELANAAYGKEQKMSQMKDMYIEELEKEWNELEAQGIPSDKAYKLASDRAYGRLQARLADQADQASDQ